MAPERKVYATPYAKGPIVTFYHKEHVELFGLKCTSCHQQESCVNCHDLKRPAEKKRSMEQVHAICSTCHKADACATCHDTVERPGFSHASTGLALDETHAALDCGDCHTELKFVRPPTCTGCHNDGRSYKKKPPGTRMSRMSP